MRYVALGSSMAAGPGIPPWTNGPGLPLPGRPMPFHHNELGMRAVAGLIADELAR